MRFIGILLGLMLASTTLTSCSQLVNNLRRDLDDSEPYSEPVSGGTWSERRMLEDDGRGPASASRGGDVRGSSWISPERAEANGRDAYRMNGDESAMNDGEQSSFSENPNMAPPVRREYRNGGRATRADFIDQSQNEGSLWASDGQTNYYFTKNKIRSVGDIVQVTLEDAVVRDTALEVKRTLTPREKETELNLAFDRKRKKVLGIEDPDPNSKDKLASSAAAPVRKPAAASTDPNAAKVEQKEPEIPPATFAEVDVGRSLELKSGDVMMAEIVARYPNGNYQIRGTKRVNYKGGSPRLLTMVGVARGADIGEDDVLASGKLYEYRLEAIR